MILGVFQNAEGESVGPSLNLPTEITHEQMQMLLNQLLQNEEPLPYSFFVDDVEIITSLQSDILDKGWKSTEDVIKIVFQPQSLFRVRAVTRNSSTLTGHTESILSVEFSPDGTRAASGSGDFTLRIWDLATETPQSVCKGHSGWVLCVAWSPDGKMIATGSMDNQVMIWDAESGTLLATLRGHAKWITSIAWKPFHLDAPSRYLASASRDGTVRVWDVVAKKMDFSIAQHTNAVTCVKWSGENLLYTASRDKTIKVWDAKDGKLCRTLVGHAHWVNTMALSTDFLMRMGPYDHNGKCVTDVHEAQALALKKYQELIASRPERMITGSDDFTMFLWAPSTDKKPIERLTGHQQLVNHVAFSPDGRYIASASFDKSIRLWCGATGKFVSALRSHVQAVYQVAFSADSRMLVSASKDSTLKLWNLKTKKMTADLPGHADEIYTVDWSGEKIMSGGKDRTIKFWR